MELAITLVVLLGAVFLFVTEKLPVDIVAVLVLCTLLVLGVVTPVEALSGFSSQATITVAAMFVLSAGLQRSGLIVGLGKQLARDLAPRLTSGNTAGLDASTAGLIAKIRQAG